MEALLSLYRRTVATDLKDTLQPANAHTLQCLLYENADVFGHLCKYDNFHRAFGVPPNPCESVTFIRFWRGVEDVVTGPEPVITGSASIELQKSLFVEDALLRTMRQFRDELLKHSSQMSMPSFMSVIDTCSKNSELEEFWSRVRENSRRTFSYGEVDINDISDMIFGHLCQRFCSRPERAGNLCTISTCISIEGGDDLADTPSAHSLSSAPSSGRSVQPFEERYRQLLEDLDTRLPAVYNRFCQRIDELTEQRQQLETECETRGKQLDDLRSELAAAKLALQSRCDQLQESNSSLHRKVESQELELDNYRIQVANLQRRADSRDSPRLREELSTSRRRCASLERMNVDLRHSLDQAESLYNSALARRSDSVEVCVGTEVERPDLDVADSAVPDGWSTSEDRANLLQELDSLRAEKAALSHTTCEMSRRLESLSGELELALRKNEAAAERLKFVVPGEKHEAEKRALQTQVADLESRLLVLHDLVASLRKTNENVDTERRSLLCAKSDLEREVAASKSTALAAECELESLRQKCVQLESDVAATSDLRRQLQEYRVSNAELQDKIDAVTRENLGLVSRLEELSAPLTSMSALAAKQVDSSDYGCSALSARTETTDCDEDERPDANAHNLNMIRISPALAEMRRLNTLNALKYGDADLGLGDSHMFFSSGLEDGACGPLVYRQVFGFPRAPSVELESDDIALLHDPRELGLDDNPPVSDEAAPDALHAATSYLSDALNFAFITGGSE
ncbi:CAP-Gly domain-containing linker protein 1-like isoform X1 [Babesia caballi]|uniref:CAP-Gly domain-containing linker protein 1-like isoform X1 n=1 Tax=Babesia caballi TaxID=5871 RepID=A0AAV4M058_BABCB|nr:CAP-Gly domain-containing linker protein 1-like isoform X1 [Babesia caballi]